MFLTCKYNDQTRIHNKIIRPWKYFKAVIGKYAPYLSKNPPELPFFSKTLKILTLDGFFRKQTEEVITAHCILAPEI